MLRQKIAHRGPRYDRGIRQTFFQSFKKRLASLIASERGNVAMVFGLSIIPLVAIAGAAVDYSRAAATKSRLQTACDAGALAGMRARMRPGADYTAAAQAYFKQNVPAELQNEVPNVTLTPDGLGLTLSVNKNVPTTTLALVNVNSIDVSVTCTATYGTLMPMEVAFVLDYSGSMTGDTGNGQQKWEAMRDATQQLIHQLTANGSFTDVAISLVPFSRYVRASLPAQYVRNGTGGIVTDCFTDRDYPFNISDSTPDASDASKWPLYTVNDDHSNRDAYCNEMANNNLDVLPLTNDYTLVADTLQSFAPANWTNIQLGIAFGWHVLSDNEPFTEGTSYNNPDRPKVMIILSDGRHNQKGKGPGGIYTVSQGETNIETLCTNIKDKGVTVFTIAYDIQDEATRTRLRQCSSAPNSADNHPYYFEPYNGEELFSVFAGIGYQLNPDSLHVSR